MSRSPRGLQKELNDALASQSSSCKFDLMTIGAYLWSCTSIILVLGISSHNSWPKKAELRLDTVRPYSYGSTPEAGRPKLPFENNSIRKSTEDPFFDVIYYEDDDYEDEDDPLATAQQPIQRPEEHDEILTRDELKSREGNLIGLHWENARSFCVTLGRSWVAIIGFVARTSILGAWDRDKADRKIRICRMSETLWDVIYQIEAARSALARCMSIQ